ncbi:MAG: hypothetical protein PHR35_04140 [Kiritimatiellae bacterium]|nr:hypothetical protein [Kiritimatiellia bacterium]
MSDPQNTSPATFHDFLLSEQTVAAVEYMLERIAHDPVLEDKMIGTKAYGLLAAAWLRAKGASVPHQIADVDVGEIIRLGYSAPTPRRSGPVSIICWTPIDQDLPASGSTVALWLPELNLVAIGYLCAATGIWRLTSCGQEINAGLINSWAPLTDSPLPPPIVL